MAVPLDVVLAGFNNDQVDPIKRILKSGGFNCSFTLVFSETEWKQAIRSAPNLIIASSEDGAFSGLKALRVFKKIPSKIPFILIAYSDLGHAAALRGLSEGASDYVLFRDLPRLPHSIRRSLSLVRESSAREAAETFYKNLEGSYQELLDVTHEGTYRATPDGRFVEVSPAMVRMFGYPDADELLSAKGIKELLLAPCEQRPIDEEDTERILILDAVNADGEKMWVEDESHLVLGEGGEILYVEGIVRDITAKKRAEETLRQRERQYHAIFQEVQDAILILNDEGVVLNMNPAANGLFGIARKQLLGRTSSNLVGKKFQAEFQEFLEDLVTNGKAHFSNINLRSAEGIFSASIKGSRLRVKHNPHLMLVIRDISDTERARRAQAWLIQGLGAVPTMVFITDQKESIRWINAAVTKNTGIKEEFAVGKKPSSYIQGYEGSTFKINQLESIESGKWRGKAFIRRTEGDPIPVVLSVNMVSDENNDPLGYVFICEDETKLRSLEMEKAELEYEFTRKSPHEMLNVIASGLLGNIRYPLSNFRTNAEQSLKRLETVLNNEGESSIALYDEIDKGIYYLDKLRNQLSDLDRMLIDAFRYAQVTHEPVEDKIKLNSNVEAAMSFFYDDLEKRRNIIVTEEYSDEEYMIEARISDLQLVLFNLILNAVDAVSEAEEPEIKITTGLNDDGYAFLEVIDNGVGIPSEDLRRIGEAYFTTKETDDRLEGHGSGSGLGLFSTVRLVEMRRGLLEVTSAPGNTSFRACFRLAANSNHEGNNGN